MADMENKADAAPADEPLPIWFFVGLILLVYGILVLVGHFTGAPRQTVLAETKPGLWWGAIITLAGGVFLGIGLRARG